LHVLNNDIGFGGDEPVHGTNATGLLVRGDKIHDGKTDGYVPGWESGGLKMTALAGGTWDSNEVYNNVGPGLWCDIDCQNLTISNNRVYNNSDGAGIMYEISVGGSINGNVVYGNGRGLNWGWGAGILVSSSDGGSNGLSIHNNVVAWNEAGISIISQNRGDQPYTGAPLTGCGTCNIDAYDNTVLVGSTSGTQYSLAWLQDWTGTTSIAGGTLVANTYCTASNVGDAGSGQAGSYWYPAGENGQTRFSWGDSSNTGCAGDIPSLSSFTSTAGERSAVYLTNTQEAAVVSQYGLPSTPSLP